MRASHCGPSFIEGNTYAAAANCTDPRLTPVRGSMPSAKLKGVPTPRRSPRALRYKSSLGLDVNSDCKRATASAVGTCIGKLAVEWTSFCWKAAKKNVLFLRTGPPAVNPKVLLLNTDWGMLMSLLRLETEVNRCDW